MRIAINRRRRETNTTQKRDSYLKYTKFIIVLVGSRKPQSNTHEERETHTQSSFSLRIENKNESAAGI